MYIYINVYIITYNVIFIALRGDSKNYVCETFLKFNLDLI